MMRRRGRTHSSGYDDVLARLRAADPATSLPPADPAHVAELRDAAILADRPRLGQRAARRPALALAAAAAAVVVVAGVAWQIGGAQEPAPTAGSGPAATQDTTTALTLPEQVAARCMVPNAAVLSQQEIAFGGTVTAAADGLVTLAAERWFAGDATETVTVAEPDETMQAVLLSVDLEVGGSYLISARDGVVSLCGMSGPVTPELEAIYAEAWPA